MKKTIFALVGFVVMLSLAAPAFADTATKESFGAQAGQRAAEYKATAEKTTAEVQKTTQDSAKILQDQFNKTMTDLQAQFNQALAELSRQIEDFKTKFAAGQQKS